MSKAWFNVTKIRILINACQLTQSTLRLCTFICAIGYYGTSFTCDTSFLPLVKFIFTKSSFFLTLCWYPLRVHIHTHRHADTDAHKKACVCLLNLYAVAHLKHRNRANYYIPFLLVVIKKLVTIDNVSLSRLQRSSSLVRRWLVVSTKLKRSLSLTITLPRA